MPHAMNHIDDKIPATPCHLVVSRLLAAVVGHQCNSSAQNLPPTNVASKDGSLLYLQ